MTFRASRVCLVLLAAAILSGAGCRVVEWVGGITHDTLDGSALKPYLEAATRSDRADLGFTALPPDGDVGVEIPRFKRNYDVMLHIERGQVSRTVAYLWRDEKLVWSGEQEIHSSGRFFKTVDGDVAEQISLTYPAVAGVGVPGGGSVSYWGPDQALQQRSTRQQLSVADANRIWQEWSK